MPIEDIYSFLTYPKTHEKSDEEIEGIHIKPDQGNPSRKTDCRVSFGRARVMAVDS